MPREATQKFGLRRIIIIVVLSAVLTQLAIYTTLHGLDRFREDKQRGREVADRLNKQFQADPRFRGVRAIGFTGSGGFFMSSGQFFVTGEVASSNDLVALKRVIKDANPPGTVENMLIPLRRPESSPTLHRLPVIPYASQTAKRHSTALKAQIIPAWGTATATPQVPRHRHF